MKIFCFIILENATDMIKSISKNWYDLKNAEFHNSEVDKRNLTEPNLTCTDSAYPFGKFGVLQDNIPNPWNKPLVGTMPFGYKSFDPMCLFRHKQLLPTVESLQL